MNTRLLNLLKLAVGIGLLYLLFQKLQDPAGLWRQIVNANKGLLLVGAGCYAVAVALSGMKWGILLHAIGIPVPAVRLLAYQWVAEFFNNFLPAQVGGDVMRGYALASDTHRAADAAASVLIDRFIGLLVFMAAAAAAALIMLGWGRPDGSRFVGESLLSLHLILLGSLGITLALLTMLVALLSRRLKQWVERLLCRLPFSHRLLPVWQKLAAAFNAYRHQYRALLLTAAGSTIIVVLTSINIWLIAAAIAPKSVSLLEVLAINPIIVLVGLLVPLSPGGLGVRQSAFVATFLLIGASGDLGLAVGLLQQFIGYLVSLPGGLLWMRGGLAGRTAQTAVLPADAPIKPYPR
ncbi:MAG: flippase-like domain-containing protein [Chloroflexota bacterium]|nr:flippase-like domain-containing protein [Chloroflexota bacterium]